MFINMLTVTPTLIFVLYIYIPPGVISVLSCLMKVAHHQQNDAIKVSELFELCMSEYRAVYNNHCYYDYISNSPHPVVDLKLKSVTASYCAIVVKKRKGDDLSIFSDLPV